MQDHRSPKARITAEIPAARVDLTLGDKKSMPVIGDIAELDHGFTTPAGVQAAIAVCRNPDGSVRWVADVLVSEMEAIHDNG